MRLPQSGGCRCGLIRYTITRAADMAYTCHCTDCQRFTGSAFSLGLVVAAEAFAPTGSEPRPLRHTADSGRLLTRWLCPGCAAWVWSGAEPGAAPPGARIAVRAGTLDDTSWLRPTLHFWTRSAQPWVVLPEGGTRFETQPAEMPWRQPAR